MKTIKASEIRKLMKQIGMHIKDAEASIANDPQNSQFREGQSAAYFYCCVKLHGMLKKKNP